MPLVHKSEGSGKAVVERVKGAKVEYSKTSIVFFDQLYDALPDPENIFYVTHQGEFKLEKKYFDFKYHNKLIEWAGNFYHADPRYFSANSKMMGHVAKDIWAKDAEKAEIAKKHGYDLLVIWEDSYFKEKRMVFEMAIEFLLGDTKTG